MEGREAKMICGNCGRENPLEASHCAHCGVAVPTPWGTPPPRRSWLPAISLLMGLLGFLGVSAVIGLWAALAARRRGLRGPAVRWGLGLSVAWLALVAVGAVPVFLRARESARQVHCLSNVYNLAMAMNMYAIDWERFPVRDTWCEALSPYVGDKGFVCPSAHDGRCSYGFNRVLSFARAQWLPDPGRVVTVFETDAGWNGVGGRDAVIARHSGGSNFGLADGHGRFLANSDSPELVWNPFAKPIPPPPIVPEAAVFAHPREEANRWFVRVTNRDRSVIPELKRALLSLRPLDRGGARWAPPLVTVLLKCGQPELERAAQDWLEGHSIPSIVTDWAEYGIKVAIGTDVFDRRPEALAVAYECGPYQLRVAVLPIPPEAGDWPDDPAWGGNTVYQIFPKDEQASNRPSGLAASRFEQPKLTGGRWVQYAETFKGRRVILERSPESRDWVWGGASK